MAQMIYDVVCDMSTEMGEWTEKAEYNGKTYYFCSGGCRVDFNKEPEKYLAKFAAEHPGLQPTPG